MPRLVRNCAPGRGIQYAELFILNHDVSERWIVRLRGR
jgi:hypothetical protein